MSLVPIIWEKCVEMRFAFMIMKNRIILDIKFIELYV